MYIIYLIPFTKKKLILLLSKIFNFNDEKRCSSMIVVNNKSIVHKKAITI